MERDVEDVRAELVDDEAERDGAGNGGGTVALAVGQADQHREREREDHRPDVPALLEVAEVEPGQPAHEWQEAADESEQAERKDHALHHGIEPWAGGKSRGIAQVASDPCDFVRASGNRVWASTSVMTDR